MNSATRQRIVMTALELFYVKGFNSTSISDILSRSQANSGSLYHFFPGKQDLLVAVLELYRDGIGDMLLAPAWDGVEDPIERIFALLNGYRTGLMVSDFEHGCPIGNLALEISEPDPKIRGLLDRNFKGWIDAVEGCLDDAGAMLPADTDRHALAEFILTTMEGAIMQARTAQDIGVFDRNIAVLRSHLDLLMEKAKEPS
ncbi:TetR/AcrR family transcriptional regulator [Parerythrobacter aestuarii]|uniref:TetR/AcrR family transcriptional regulator n=1 Tax=Parerythrobacter aestuarii TaxID=3020909 RepID=UPI0024DEAB48|nr:TetR/AcrR family transcriptional regulator [Parerythrobacter aestuarii]